MGRLTRKYPVVRVGPAQAGRRIETVAVEEPLEIRLNGESFVVTMRTPGADIDLIHGLLHSEGVIAERGGHLAGPLLRGLGPRRREHLQRAGRQPGPARRAAAGRPAATGADHQCLRALWGDQHRSVLRDSRYPLDHELRVSPELIMAAPNLLREQQRAFDQTGGLHAAGLLGPDGILVCVREDVGRHNAVDKVVGWAIREGRLPLREMILVVSGRASFELTQKAVLAGIPDPGGGLGAQLAGRRAGQRGRAHPGRVRPRRDDEHLRSRRPDRGAVDPPVQRRQRRSARPRLTA